MRQEVRYIVENPHVEELCNQLESVASKKEFPNEYNHTIYFNNPEHEVPFEVSVKGRRYSSQPFVPFLNLQDKWIFETKKDILSENSRLREKERKNLTLAEILQELSLLKEIQGSLISLPLKPRIADSYRRYHYLVNGEDSFRITLDDKLVYYFFEEEFSGRELGKENYTRVEIKIPEDKIKSPEVYKIERLLEKAEAIPVISKKDMGYNLLSQYLRNKYHKKVPASNTEIESKLILSRENQGIFHQIKRDLENNELERFSVLEEFPYVLEGGKLHHYLINSDKDYFRISAKGNSKSIVSKENPQIISDPFGLECILKRREIQTPFEGEVPSSLKTLYRKRKYFLAENEKTRNSYCILIDRCSHGSSELFQIEIEGLLLDSSPLKENEIIQEIADLTNQVVQHYPVLKPSPLTKLDWLKSL